MNDNEMMSENKGEQDNKKRYYWLKLEESFFTQKVIKKIRKEKDGDRLLTIFLKMQLKALRGDGVLEYLGI